MTVATLRFLIDIDAYKPLKLDPTNGTPLGHDAISPDLAIAYLETRGHTQAINYLKQIVPLKGTYIFTGSSSAVASVCN